ncbi:YnbE family lipoprotein [Sphingomonas koreensis]|nr:YnbE family lipoprotein [Sphingomonas koreensis]
MMAMRQVFQMALIGATAMLGGCVTVNAPDKPIEIDLNINVTQQVVYKLDDSAKSVIKDNPGIF